MGYNGKDGVYTYTYPVERFHAKGHPAFPLAVVPLSVTGGMTLGEVQQMLVANRVATFEGDEYSLANPNLKTATTRLYSTAAAFEEMDRPNLSRTLTDLGLNDGDRIFV